MKDILNFNISQRFFNTNNPKYWFLPQSIWQEVLSYSPGIHFPSSSQVLLAGPSICYPSGLLYDICTPMSASPSKASSHLQQ